MVFWRYPMDQHICNLRLASCGYDSSQLRISGQFSYDKTSQRDLQFFTDMRELARDKRTWQGEEKNYSMYGVEILLTRSLYPFIISVYIPSTLLVMLSWISFYLPPDLPRLFLLLLTILILINMLSTVRSSAPLCYSVTALEVWLL